MHRERVADDIYVFTSERYAQVTAGIVLTTDGAVLIDTLLFPEETLALKQYVETRLRQKVRYVINTHYHADHTYGTYLFPNATVIAHAKCADLLETRGRAALAEARVGSTELAEVEVILPQVVFNESEFLLTIGDKSFQLTHTPGHSPDSICVLVREDRVLFAADTLMAIPFFVDGDYSAFRESLRAIPYQLLENIVQGHGEVVLRGEIEGKIRSDLRYLEEVRKHVEIAHSKADPEKYFDGIDLEKFGKSRILLGGKVRALHRANLQALYHRLYDHASAG
ncbi:MAG TPA: MBL fold metallo-hydrolase [Aggregatilineales bacterium]|nr:MBL fold metallo-hydrolase [Anaerolineales bacterium]HRE46383.1 MBL fold metallo-hydrolase [Aggregatilineales bacterium]